MESKARSDGFTLVELLVVISILGLLSLVAVFAVRGVTDSGDEAACAEDRMTLVKAAEAFSVLKAHYGTEAELVAAGLLRAPSTLHDVVLSGDGYAVTSAGGCVGESDDDGGGGPLAVNDLQFDSTPTAMTAGVVISPAISVSVHGPDGQLLHSSGLPVTIALASPSGATLSGTLTVNTVDGVATFADLSVDRSGGYSFVASMAGAASQVGTAFEVAAGIPTHLAFAQQPSNGIAATAMTNQPQVKVLDALGNTVTAVPSNVTLGITAGTGTAGALLSCTANPTASVSGVATFAGCKIDIAGSGYTITASTPGLTAAVSNVVSVTGPPTKLVITQQPTNVIANAAIAPAVTVTVQDALNRVVTVGSATVTLTISTNPGSSTLGGTTSAPVVNGVATFTSLSLNKPGTAYKLTAASSGLTAAVSSAFNVAIGPAAKLAVTTQPGGVKAGVVWTTQPKVTVQDAYGNTVTTSTAPVSLAVTSGTGTAGASLTCTTNPVSAAAGIATFAGCKIGSPGAAYTLTATSGSLTSGVTPPFDNPAGAATKLTITQQPTTVVAGASIAPSVTVTVQDAVGNTVTGSSVTVALTLSTNPGSSTLSGTTSVTAVNGVATFSSLSLNKVGVGYKMTAAATGLTSAVSGAFNVTVGAPAKLTVTTQPAGAKAGVAWTTQPTVTVQDAVGNTITTSTAPITLAITSGTGTDGAALTCTANPKAAVAGIATFAGCKIGAPGSGYRVTATSPGLSGGVTTAFDNPIGPATKVVITQQPTNVVAGAVISPSMTVTVQDAVGNTVVGSSATVTLTITTNPSSSTLSGTTSVTAVNGVATFSSLSLNKVGVGYKLTAASTGLTSAVSGAFNVTVGAPAKLAFSIQPGGGARNVIWATQPRVLVQDALGNTITTSTASVTVTITGGTGTSGAVLTCTANPKAAVAGLVTYAGCKISTAGTGYTLTATSTGLTAAVSSTFTIT